MTLNSVVVAALAAVSLAACDVTMSASGGGGGSRFLARNNYVVVSGPGGGEFTVLGKAGAAGPDYFCAAADYAHRRLGYPDAERVVLIAPVAKNPAYNGQRTGTFRVASSGQVPPRTGISVSMRKAGENLQIGHARSMCETHPVGFFD